MKAAEDFRGNGTTFDLMPTAVKSLTLLKWMYALSTSEISRYFLLMNGQTHTHTHTLRQQQTHTPSAHKQL